MTKTKPKVAFIGTGGTIASIGKGPLDILDYAANETVMHADEIVRRVPALSLVAEVLPITFCNVPSHYIYFQDWRALVLLCERLARARRSRGHRHRPWHVGSGGDSMVPQSHA